MRFAKYHGIGNDFVLVADPDDRVSLTAEVVARLCDRHFGIGADGVIRVAPGPDGTDLFMDYVNSDGSIGEMCGNGIRCLALFARSEGMVASESLRIATRAGIKRVWIEDELVRVDMGAPIFRPDLIPMTWDEPDALHAKLQLESETLEAACLSMGNPHAVLFVDEPDDVDLRTLGPRLEQHDVFPKGANIEFAKVESPTRVRMRVWERGSGETLACGTGAAAVGVATRLLEGADNEMTVVLPGGELSVAWAGSLEDEQPVYMAGPAVEVFTGSIDPEDLV